MSVRTTPATPTQISFLRGLNPALRVAAIVLAAIGLVWLLGTTNPVTPAGYVGYLTRGAVFGKARFIGLQTGPTSFGRSWLMRVTNVSVTPYTYTEEFSRDSAVLSKDNLQVAFRVHVVWRVKPESVREFIELFSTLTEGMGDVPDSVVETAYGNCLREPLRTFARDEIQQLDGLQIKNEITPIGERILKRVREITQNTPFDIKSVVVGNIQYPTQVAEAVERKLAATQELERKETEILIARKEKEKRIVEAEGVAEANRIIDVSLTPFYLQYEAIKAQKEMTGSPNHTVVYIPSGPMGVPLVSPILAPGAKGGDGLAPSR